MITFDNPSEKKENVKILVVNPDAEVIKSPILICANWDLLIIGVLLKNSLI